MTGDRLWVVGEALVDVVAPPNGPERVHPGGSPANTALGLARLGRSVELTTRIGTDAHGALLRDWLSGAGVRLTPGSVVDAPTSTATALLDRDGSAVYRFDLDWRLPEVEPPAAAGHLHTGSVAAFLEPGATRVHALVDAARPGRTVSYDPNLRPALLGTPEQTRPGVERLVAAADLVKASEEDLAWLHPGRPPAEVAAEWARSGPALVVLTRGAHGADAHWGRDGFHRVPAPRVRVADTIGAGDAFMAGLLSGLVAAGLLGGPDARERLRTAARGQRPHPGVAAALELAVRVAALTCERPGADPPTQADLSEHR